MNTTTIAAADEPHNTPTTTEPFGQAESPQRGSQTMDRNSIQLFIDYSNALFDAMDDPDRTASILATMRQEIHVHMLTLDPEQTAMADITRENGRYVGGASLR